MKKLTLLLFIFCITILSCSPRRAKKLPEAKYLATLPINTFSNPSFELPKISPTPSRLTLSMERQPCMIGKCPAFAIYFYEDGTVQYSGNQDVEMIGDYASKIEQSELKTLLNLAKNINYFDFQNVYPTSSKIIMDVPLTITYVKADLEENYVENHHHAPISLIRFEEHIEELIGNLEWKEIVNQNEDENE
jgi:hypothetical protein